MRALQDAMRSTVPVRLFSAIALLLMALPLSAGAERVTLELRLGLEAAPSGGRLPFVVVAHIARGWHINAHRPAQSYLIPSELRLILPPGVDVEAVHYPVPQRKVMTFAGGEELLVHTGDVAMSTTLLLPPTFAPDRVRVETVFRYQACNDTTCLPPDEVKAETIVPVTRVGDAGTLQTAPGSPAAGGATRFDRWLARRGLLFTLLAVGLIGLGLNLTPCVYPLISVTIAYFGRQSRGRSGVVRLAVLYVLGIAVSFSAVGLAAALSGGLFGAALREPTVVVFIAGVLVVLALGSFGFYQFQLPAALARRAGRASGGALGALFMGLTMGIVAAPCVGPIVVGLLVFVGSRQDPLLGFLLFFAMGVGMGAPYVALAVAAGSLERLPRSGEWLVWTDRLFGCLLLALAAYFVAPLLPQPARQYLLPAVIGLSAVYLGFVERAGSDRRGFTAFKWSVSSVLLAAAVWHGWDGGTRPSVAWEPAAALAELSAKADFDRPLVIDFAAEWCIPCRQMEHTTYVHPDVVREAKGFRMVRVDITHPDAVTDRIIEKYGVVGVPTVIVFSIDGRERQRMVGYVGAGELLAAMRAVS